ncbi:hypothetical protein J4217_03510 [Candidatus Pacearchaeota archaeon]|nr:hypothetical protein [Candidatus Pacearchaeota archaeon]
MQKIALLALLITLLGSIDLLFLLILPINIIKITANSQINSLEINQKIMIEGKVSYQKTSSSTSIIIINNFTMKVPNSLVTYSLMDRTVQIYGIVNGYYNNKTIKITKIETK